jgi:AmiR/NasT family two-component response regulator
MELFAAQATIFISNAQARESAQQLSGTLREALSNREVIAAGRGVLMERHGIDEETAMQQLMTESRRARKPLREVSAAIVDSALRTGG